MAIDFTQFEATIQTKLDAVTDEKEMLLLGKAIESTIDNITLSDLQNEGSTQINNVIAEGNTQVTRVEDEGDAQVNNLQAASSGFANLSGATFTGDITAPNLELSGFLRGPSNFTIDPAAFGDNTGTVIISGDLQVDGTATTINSTTLDVEDLNITVANGATDAASANGAGLTVNGASATISYAAGTDTWDFNKPAVLPGMNIDGTTELEDIKEKFITDGSSSGTLTVNANNQGIVYLTANQSANRALNIVGDGTTTLDAYLSTGQSVTLAVLATQGSTAYYFDTIQVDGTTVTPKWQGGEAPTEGNPDSIDTYSFTVIKTGASTFTVLAAQTQFA